VFCPVNYGAVDLHYSKTRPLREGVPRCEWCRKSSHLLDLQQRGIMVVIAGQIAFGNERAEVEYQP